MTSTTGFPPLAWARLIGLVIWVIGVQVSEGVATVGLVLTAVASAPLLRKLALRDWVPLWAWLLWALVVPWLFGGGAPSGTGVGRALDWLMVPLLVAGLPSTPRRRLIVIVAAVVLVLSSLAAGLQHFGWWPSEAAMAPLAWAKLPVYRVYEPVPDSDGRFMGGGLLFHRLKFAHVSSLLVVALAVIGAKGSGRSRAGAWAVAAWGTLAVWVFPYARMASAALSATLVLTAGILAPNRRRAALLALALISLASLTVAGVEPLRARFLTALTTEGSGDRRDLLTSGLRAIESHPFAGVGLGQFRPALFAPDGTPQYVLDNPGKAHNQFVSMAAEIGLPGAVLFVVMLLTFAQRARRTPLGAMTLSALAFFFALSMAHDPLFQAPFSMTLVLAIGAGLAKGEAT